MSLLDAAILMVEVLTVPVSLQLGWLWWLTDGAWR